MHIPKARVFNYVICMLVGAVDYHYTANTLVLRLAAVALIGTIAYITERYIAGSQRRAQVDAIFIRILAAREYRTIPVSRTRTQVVTAFQFDGGPVTLQPGCVRCARAD